MSDADDYHPFIPDPPDAKIAGPTARAHAQTRTDARTLAKFLRDTGRPEEAAGLEKRAEGR